MQLLIGRPHWRTSPLQGLMIRSVCRLSLIFASAPLRCSLPSLIAARRQDAEQVRLSLYTYQGLCGCVAESRSQPEPGNSYSEAVLRG